MGTWVDAIFSLFHIYKSKLYIIIFFIWSMHLMRRSIWLCPPPLFHPLLTITTHINYFIILYAISSKPPPFILRLIHYFCNVSRSRCDHEKMKIHIVSISSNFQLFLSYHILMIALFRMWSWFINIYSSFTRVSYAHPLLPWFVSESHCTEKSNPIYIVHVLGVESRFQILKVIRLSHIVLT